MKAGAILGFVAGLGLAAWLLADFGVGRILDLLAHAGLAGVLAVIAFHGVQVACSAAAWRTIVGPVPHRPGLAGFVRLRWIREAVNNLLPVAQIGGEFAASRLLRRQGVSLASAIAGTVADLTTEMITQIAFTLLGLGLLLHGGSGGGEIAGSVVAGVLVAVLVAAAFLGAQWWGLAAAIERGLLRLGRLVGWGGMGEVTGLHEALIARYRKPGRMALAGGWHMASWLLGGLEVQAALYFLGHAVGPAAGLVIESLGQALKAVGFAVPGALGVQEGGLIVVCHLFGLAPDVAIALSLMKRLRELILGVPGLLAWQHGEMRAARHRPQAAEGAAAS